MIQPKKYTWRQLIDCAKREAEMRKKVYTRRVNEGSMGKPEKDKEIAMMKEIARLLEASMLMDQGQIRTRQPYAEGTLERYTFPHSHGVGLVEYIDGVFDGITNMHRLYEVDLSFTTRIHFPIHSNQIGAWEKKYGVKLIRIETLAIHQKIAAFCAAYQAEYQQTYTVGPKDKRLWISDTYQHVPADAQALAYYMTHHEYPLNGPKCISDYLNHYSELDSILKVSGGLDENGLPARYDARLYTRLEKENPQLWMSYRAKLRHLGYEEKTTPKGKTWIRQA